jgi:hypothetical protein
MEKYTFNIFADYHLVFIQDETVLENGLDISDSITDQTCKDMVALEMGTICIMPVRNMTVPIEIEIIDESPSYKLDGWDQVVDCGIDIPSGKVVIYGATDDTSKSPRVALAPGNYKARIYYGGLHTLNPSGTEGADHYKIVLWPGKSTEVQFIKKYQKINTYNYKDD